MKTTAPNALEPRTGAFPTREAASPLPRPPRQLPPSPPVLGPLSQARLGKTKDPLTAPPAPGAGGPLQAVDGALLWEFVSLSREQRAEHRALTPSTKPQRDMEASTVLTGFPHIPLPRPIHPKTFSPSLGRAGNMCDCEPPLSG